MVTEAGRAFYEQCAHALDRIDNAEAVVRDLAGRPAGRLRVLTPFAFGAMTLEPRLADFYVRFPDVRIELVLDNEPLDLVAHGFDVAIREGQLVDSSYAVRRLGASDAGLYASPGYLAAHGMPLELADMARHATLGVATARGLLPWTLTDGQTSVTVDHEPVFVCNDPAVILAHCRRGAGIALLSRIVCETTVAQGELVRVLPNWARPADLEVSLIFPRRATLDRKVRAFIDYLVETLTPTFDSAAA
jgi:DNA-binding transcriptional LysR family regulator